MLSENFRSFGKREVALMDSSDDNSNIVLGNQLGTEDNDIYTNNYGTHQGPFLTPEISLLVVFAEKPIYEICLSLFFAEKV